MNFGRILRDPQDVKKYHRVFVSSVLIVGIIAYLIIYKCGIVTRFPCFYAVRDAFASDSCQKMLTGLIFGTVLSYWLERNRIAGKGIRSDVASPGKNNIYDIAIVFILAISLLYGIFGVELYSYFKSIKTPFAEIEFAVRSRSTLETIIEIEEQKKSFEGLQNIANVCKAVEKEIYLINHLKDNKKCNDYEYQYDIYVSEKALFDKLLNPIAQEAIHAYNNGYDNELIKDAIRPINSALKQIITIGDDAPESELISDIDQLSESLAYAHNLLRKPLSKDQAIDNALFSFDKDISKCEIVTFLISNRIFSLRDARYLYLALDNLMVYTGNIIGAYEVLQRAYERMNSDKDKWSEGVRLVILYSLPFVKYMINGDSEDIIECQYLDEALDAVIHYLAFLNDIPNNEIIKRFERIQMNIKNLMAYYLALSNKRKEYAQEYARDLLSKCYLTCYEDMKYNYLDTYAMVNIHFASREQPINQSLMREMIVILKNCLNSSEDEIEKNEEQNDMYSMQMSINSLRLFQSHLDYAEKVMMGY